LEEEKNLEDQKQQENKEKEDRREKYKDVDHFEALCKIMKHIYEEKKFSKCLQMLERLLDNFFDCFDGHTLFNVLEGVMRYEKKFESKEDREAIERLYLLLMEISENYNNENQVQEETFFSEQEEAIIELYYIPVIVESNLYTDDSFKFNEVVREIVEMLESLEPYSYKCDRFSEITTSQAIL